MNDEKNKLTKEQKGLVWFIIVGGITFYLISGGSMDGASAISWVVIIFLSVFFGGMAYSICVQGTDKTCQMLDNNKKTVNINLNVNGKEVKVEKNDVNEKNNNEKI